MIGQAVKGIADAIRTEFGDSYGIYTEEPAQDMQRPAFFIRCGKMDMKNELGTRRRMDLLCKIQYFAASATPGGEINDTLWRLSQCLEWIAVEEKRVRGTVGCEDIIDNVLTATAEYTFFLNVVRTGECMEAYEMKGEVTDGNSKSSRG